MPESDNICKHCNDAPVSGPTSELCKSCYQTWLREIHGPWRKSGICGCGRVQMSDSDEHDCNQSLGLDED